MISSVMTNLELNIQYCFLILLNALVCIDDVKIKTCFFIQYCSFSKEDSVGIIQSNSFI